MEKIPDEQVEILRDLSKSRYKIVWDSYFYSSQRFDLLLIAVSGACIYALAEIAKIYFVSKLTIPLEFKISLIFLITTILLNLISQYFSIKIHRYDFVNVHYQIISKITEQQDVIYKENELIIKKYNNLVKKLNVTSMISMLIGISIMITKAIIIF